MTIPSWRHRLLTPQSPAIGTTGPTSPTSQRTPTDAAMKAFLAGATWMADTLHAKHPSLGLETIVPDLLASLGTPAPMDDALGTTPPDAILTTATAAHPTATPVAPTPTEPTTT